MVKTRRGGENVGRDSEGSENRGGEWNQKDSSQHSRAELCDLNVGLPPLMPRVLGPSRVPSFLAWRLLQGIEHWIFSAQKRALFFHSLTIFSGRLLHLLWWPRLLRWPSLKLVDISGIVTAVGARMNSHEVWQRSEDPGRAWGLVSKRKPRAEEGDECVPCVVLVCMKRKFIEEIQKPEF